MEIQVPLILFTSLLAWAAGILATLGIATVKRMSAKAQVPELIVGLVVLAVGGVAVLFHLTQPLHIFNGFGNPTSGITQELAAIVVLVVVMVVYFALTRRSDDGIPPAWIAIVLIVMSAVLDVVMAHSYMMASRPFWDSALQVLSILGASCVLGPATFALVAALVGDDTFAAQGGLLALWGAVVNAVTTVLYLASSVFVGDQFTDLGHYFDPTFPMMTVFDADFLNPFSGSALLPSAWVVVGVVVSVLGAVMGKRSGNWKLWGAVVVVAGLVATIALRVTFYALGYDSYPFYMPNAL